MIIKYNASEFVQYHNTMHRNVICLLLLQIKVFCSSSNLKFIQQPVSQNVSLGSEATFNCTAHSLYYYWLVNGKIITHDNNKNREISTDDETVDSATNLKIHILSLPAININDGIITQCFISNSFMTLKSSKGILQIQGPLDPVSELEAIWLNSSSIQVSFSPPNTLDGVPINNYTVELTSMNITYTYNTKETTLIIANDFSWCFDYYVTVSAWNNAGEGNKSLLLKRDKQIVATPMDPFNTTVSILYSIHNTVDQAILKTMTNTTHPEEPINITVTLWYYTIIQSMNESIVVLTAQCIIDTLTCDDVHFDLIENDRQDFTKIAINLTNYVTSGYHYNVTLSLANCIGRTNLSEYSFDTLPNDNTGSEELSSSNQLTTTSAMRQEFTFIADHRVIQPTSVYFTQTYVPNVSNSSPSTSPSWILGLIIALLLLISGTVTILVVIFIVIIMQYKRKNEMLKLVAAEKNVHNQKYKNNESKLDTFTMDNFINSEAKSGDPADHESQQSHSSLATDTDNHQYECIEYTEQPETQEVTTGDCPAYGKTQSIYMRGTIMKRYIDQ